MRQYTLNHWLNDSNSGNLVTVRFFRKGEEMSKVQFAPRLHSSPYCSRFLQKWFLWFPDFLVYIISTKMCFPGASLWLKTRTNREEKFLLDFRASHHQFSYIDETNGGGRDSFLRLCTKLLLSRNVFEMEKFLNEQETLKILCAHSHFTRLMCNRVALALC